MFIVKIKKLTEDCTIPQKAVPSSFMRKIVCRLRLSEVSRQ